MMQMTMRAGVPARAGTNVQGQMQGDAQSICTLSKADAWRETFGARNAGGPPRVSGVRLSFALDGRRLTEHDESKRDSRAHRLSSIAGDQAEMDDVVEGDEGRNAERSFSAEI